MGRFSPNKITLMATEVVPYSLRTSKAGASSISRSSKAETIPLLFPSCLEMAMVLFSLTWTTTPAARVLPAVWWAISTGDGILDLAVSNSLSNEVAILLGNGDGGFQKPIRNSAGPSPGDIAVARDANGDGILDLVVANQTSATVSILLGKGDGTFAAPVTYPVAANAVSVQVGDFNQDGNLDLAVGTQQQTTLVDVLFGNGDGTFQPAISSPSVTGDLVSGNLTIGDFNQDGLLDVVVSGFYDVSGNYTSTLAVMLQTTAVGNTPTKTKLTFLHPTHRSMAKALHWLAALHQPRALRREWLQSSKARRKSATEPWPAGARRLQSLRQRWAKLPSRPLTRARYFCP